MHTAANPNGEIRGQATIGSWDSQIDRRSLCPLPHRRYRPAAREYLGLSWKIAIDRHLIDAQVQWQVCAQLDWDPELTDAHIDVQVHDGVAALRGLVSSCQQRWAAQSAAERVSGVRSVTSDIGVALCESSRRSDADIARSVQNMLQWINPEWIPRVPGKARASFEKSALADYPRYHVTEQAGQ